MQTKILLLTNKNNEDPEEDAFLAEWLRRFFSVEIRHPLECEDKEEWADLILIRNVWPETEYRKAWNEIKERFIHKQLKTYNPLSAKGDLQGKHYLIDLFQQGYPVIPTAASLQETHTFNSDVFISKPIHGGTSIGIKKVGASQLAEQDFKIRIVQPYVEFEYEISFYYIDNKFQHALYTPDKKQRWKLEPYQASTIDLEFAEQFVNWNNLAYGIQRIDAVKTSDGLLLLEIEDFCPYLSLHEIDSQLRASFLANFRTSLEKVMEGIF